MSQQFSSEVDFKNEVLLFKTDINTKEKVRILEYILYEMDVVRWSIDLHDCDYVLKVITKTKGLEKSIILTLGKYGFKCEVWRD